MPLVFAFTSLTQEVRKLGDPQAQVTVASARVLHACRAAKLLRREWNRRFKHPAANCLLTRIVKVQVRTTGLFENAIKLGGQVAGDLRQTVLVDLDQSKRTRMSRRVERDSCGRHVSRLSAGKTAVCWGGKTGGTGGSGRNRTGVDGFAGRCITTLLPSHGEWVGVVKPQLPPLPPDPYRPSKLLAALKKLERETRLELATLTLARLRSTN